MAITTQDGLIAARANKRQGFPFMRSSVANMAAGQPCSLYRAAGALPAQPAVPAAAAVPTKALSFNFNNPTAPDVTYLDAIGACLTQVGALNLYDRLFHNGGLSGTVTTAQAVNSQTVLTLPARGAAAAECEWFLEVYADLGATAVTANAAVTHSDATTATVAVALAATRRAGMLLPLVPAQGKYIASVQSVTLSATTGTAGSFGVSCGKRIAGATLCPPNANVQAEREAVLARVPDDACLWQVVLCGGASTGDVRGELTLIQG